MCMIKKTITKPNTKSCDWYDKLYDEIYHYEKSGGLISLFKDRYQTSLQEDDVKYIRLFRCLYEQLEQTYPLIDIQQFIYDDYTPELMYESMHKWEVPLLSAIRGSQDNIKLYRGQIKGKINGFSWTTDKNLACWFATRTNTKFAPTLITADVPTDDIWCFWNDREEKEVFAPPKHIEEIANNIKSDIL